MKFYKEMIEMIEEGFSLQLPEKEVSCLLTLQKMIMPNPKKGLPKLVS